MNWEITNGKIYCDGREVNFSLKNLAGEKLSCPLDVQKLLSDPKRFRTRLGDSFQVEKIIASGPVVTIIWKDHERPELRLTNVAIIAFILLSVLRFVKSFLEIAPQLRERFPTILA